MFRFLKGRLMRICGIDPGLTGGIAILAGKRFEAERMPVIKYKMGVKGKVQSNVDVVKIHALVRRYKPDLIVIERQTARPHQGTVSSVTSGINYGIILSLKLLGIPIDIVHPVTWKRVLECPADKKEAILFCSKLFGDKSPQRDGPAEALLLAYYGQGELKGERRE